MLQGGRYTNTFAVERERMAEYPKEYLEREIEHRKCQACRTLGDMIGRKADFVERDDYNTWARVYATSIYAFNLEEVRNIFSLVRQLKTDDEMFELMVAMEEVRNK